jgi:1-acyl-sn-glycerol-3-phosphate acyltransferase
MANERDAVTGGTPGPTAEREVLVRRVGAAIEGLVRAGYFSIDVEGAEHVPRAGPVVYAQNHAGWFALDTIILGGAVARAVGLERTPYFAAHEAALAAPVVGPFLRRLGGLPASSFRNPERLPPDIESYGICPEGVRGNTKPFWRAYRMREWSRTFVKVALVRGAPIVPVAVLGGEECLPVAWTVEVLKPLLGSVVGLPLVPIPLPTRWKIVFHPPVHAVPHGHRLRPDRDYTADVAREVQGIVQATLDREAPRRALGKLSAALSRLARRRKADAGEADPLLAADAARGAAPAGHMYR